MHNKNVYLVPILFTLLNISPCFAGIPSYILVCHRSDPKIEECILNSLEALRPKLKEGISELNVPPLEPLPLDEVILQAGPNQAKIKGTLDNLNVWGPSQFRPIWLKADIPEKKVKTRVALPTLYFKGDYDIDINVLILKYKGQGIITGNFTDYIVELTLDYNLIQKDGKDYINFPKVGVNLTPGKSLLAMNGLYDNQNSALAKGIEEVLKDNTDILITEVLPALEEGLSIRLTEISNQMAHSFPYDELLPE